MAKTKDKLLKKILFFCVLFFISNLLILYPSKAVGSYLDFVKEVGPYKKALEFLSNRKFIEDTSEEVILDDVRRIVDSIKAEGILVDSFKITTEDIKDVPLPFIIYLDQCGWRIVSGINNSTGVVTLMDVNGKKYYIKKSIFLKKCGKYVVSRVIMNKLVYKSPYDFSNISNKGKVIVVYLNHNKFKEPEKVKTLLDSLIKESESKSTERLVYIDELGLIPEETVKRRMKTLGISRREAFKQIKQAIFKEDELLAKGIPITSVDIPLYKELYKYLAKHKVTSFVEDLEYKLWNFIVEFDNLKVFREALVYFILGDFSQALNKINTYQNGFSTYNIGIRDSKFVSQIQNIRNRYPEAIIFTIRGIGHYGFDKFITVNGERVQVLAYGNNEFFTNFALQQFVYLLKRNNVKIEQSTENLFLLKTLPQEILRVYLDEHCDDINFITKLTWEIVSRLDIQALYIYSKALKEFYIEQYKNMSLYKTGKFTFEWMREHEYIKEEEVKSLGLIP